VQSYLIAGNMPDGVKRRVIGNFGEIDAKNFSLALFDAIGIYGTRIHMDWAAAWTLALGLPRSLFKPVIDVWCKLNDAKPEEV
jgi:hypothetical protein